MGRARAVRTVIGELGRDAADGAELVSLKLLAISWALLVLRLALLRLDVRLDKLHDVLLAADAHRPLHDLVQCGQGAVGRQRGGPWELAPLFGETLVTDVADRPRNLGEETRVLELRHHKLLPAGETGHRDQVEG